MRWTRLLRAIGLAGIICFVSVAFSPLPNVLFRWSGISTDIQSADAIVALGAAVESDGTLSCDSLTRATKAISLHRNGRAPIIVFSGTANREGPSEASVRAELAREMGVPPEAILTEASALTTREEAARIGGMLQGRNIKRILLVTDSQHMRRAGALFERVGLEVFPVTVDARSGAGTSPEARLRLTRELLGEWLALSYYRVAGYL